MDTIQRNNRAHGPKHISGNRPWPLPSTGKELASESQEIAQCLMRSEPEQESKSMSICSLPTHWTLWTCLFHEQRPQALRLKPVKLSQASKKQTFVQKLEGESRPWKPRQNHLMINREQRCPSRHSPCSEEKNTTTDILIKKKKISARKTVRQGEIWKVSKAPTTLHHSKEDMLKNVYKPLEMSRTAQSQFEDEGGGPQWKTTHAFSPTPSFLLAPFTSYFSIGNFYHLVPLGKRNW